LGQGFHKVYIVHTFVEAPIESPAAASPRPGSSAGAGNLRRRRC
jgi:hypothetical protein